MAASVGLWTAQIALFLIVFSPLPLYNNAQNHEGKWKKYLTLIDLALKQYEEPKGPDCAVYLETLEADLKPFVDKGGIEKADMGIAKQFGTHYQIFDHVLYREEKCMFPARCSGVEHFILGLIDKLPDMEMVINVRDHPQAQSNISPFPMLSFSKIRANSYDIMYPAWTFWEGGPAIWPLYPRGLGRWDLMREDLTNKAEEWPWVAKYDKGFFRGSRTTNERDPLVLLSRDEPDLVDAQYTKNQAWKSIEDTLGRKPAKEVTFEEHCPYKYLFNFRGVAASFRFKHLFLCGSLVFQVGDNFKEFFYDAMKPWVHYIPVKADLSNARELMEFAKENDEVVRRIADRGRDFILEFLDMKDVTCYWKKLLTRYADLLNYDLVKDSSLHKIVPPPPPRDEL